MATVPGALLLLLLRLLHVRAGPAPAAVAPSAAAGIRGLLDVTQPPFSVDRRGKTDVTKPLQEAIKHAHDAYLAVYLPLGD
jgi:hypothetical protein